MARFSLRIASLGAAVAALGLVLATASPGATNANPARIFGTSPRGVYPSKLRERPMLRSRAAEATPAPCATDFDDGDVFFAGEAGGSETFVAGVENVACGEFSSILGGTDDATGAAGTDAFIGGGEENSVGGEYGAIAGGDGNTANGEGASVAGGFANSAAGQGAFVGSGDGNSAADIYSLVVGGLSNGASAAGAVVGGGGTLTGGNQNSGRDAFIGAGDQDIIGAGSSNAFIGGGKLNTIATSAPYATIGGGDANSAGAEYATVSGGSGNAASGQYAAIAGGDGNTAAGFASFAGGYHAEAAHNGSFVWSDYASGSAVIKDPGASDFVARASGGVYLYTNEGATSGVELPTGESTWESLSDRNAKTDIAPLDDASILAKVAALPIAAWSYKSDRGVRHVGPMAQDFYAAFGTGVDDRHITSIDEDGVALAAIKALHAENGRLQRENVRLQSRLAELEAKVDRLAASAGNR